MRNMFSERKSDDYELVYHNFSENHPIPTRNTQNLNQYYSESHLNQQIAQNQHVYRIIHHNPHPIRQIQHFVPNPQPGPPEVKEEDDYEEEEAELKMGNLKTKEAPKTATSTPATGARKPRGWVLESGNHSKIGFFRRKSNILNQN